VIYLLSCGLAQLLFHLQNVKVFYSLVGLPQNVKFELFVRLEMLIEELVEENLYVSFVYNIFEIVLYCNLYSLGGS
jgi:hypothetical protein